MKVYYDVPFYTQTGNGIYNDCGETCMKITAERVYGKQTSIRQWEILTGRFGKLDSLDHLQAGATKLGLPYRVGRAQLDPVLDLVREGHLAIVLIQYERLPADLRSAAYRGGHFVIIHGFTDDDVIFTDTLATTEKAGKAKHLNRASFAHAYSYDYMIPEKSIKEIPAPKPTPSPIPIFSEDDMTHFKDAAQYQSALARMTALGILIADYQKNKTKFKFWRQTSTGMITVGGKLNDGGIWIPDVETLTTLGGHKFKPTEY